MGWTVPPNSVTNWRTSLWRAAGTALQKFCLPALFTKWKFVSMSFPRVIACKDLYKKWYVDQYMSYHQNLPKGSKLQVWNFVKLQPLDKDLTLFNPVTRTRTRRRTPHQNLQEGGVLEGWNWTDYSGAFVQVQGVRGPNDACHKKKKNNKKNPTKYFNSKKLWGSKFFVGPKKFFWPTFFFGPKSFSYLNFFSDLKFFFWTQHLFWIQIMFHVQKIFRSNFFLLFLDLNLLSNSG